MLRHILRAGLPARGVAASRGAQLTSLAKHGGLAAMRMASPGKVVATTMLAAAPVLIAAEPAPTMYEAVAEDEIDVALRECLDDEDVADGEEDGEEFDDDAALEETVDNTSNKY